jgi:Zn finger protein HypA/HybF involved in hydrogenase expression
MAEEIPDVDFDLGQHIYDDEGTKLGTIRGLDEHGFYVSTEDGIQALSAEHVTSTANFGEAELTWRCWECGAMGDIEELPEECPDCGAPKEDLYYWTED